MSCRLVVITEIIAPYRIPVFNALSRHPEIDLHVVFLAETDPTQRQWLVPREEIEFSFEVLPSWRRRIRGRNFLLNWGIENALRQASPDAIVCGGYNYIASWEAARYANRNQLPFLLWCESTAQDLRSGAILFESLKRKFFSYCGGFIAAGQSSVDYLKSYRVPEETIFTAPNAVDTHFFQSASDVARRNPQQHREPLNLPHRYFLFVGRLVPEKGVFDLLEAYGALPEKIRARVSLLYVGDGEAKSELTRRAVHIKPGNVPIAGFFQRENLAIAYALADAFVFPTHTDPWGLVVNEAMACGLPVICSRAAGCAADLVIDGENGRLVKAGDAVELASALHELASNAELRRQMGQASRTEIEANSPEACAAGMAKAALSCAHPHYARP